MISQSSINSSGGLLYQLRVVRHRKMNSIVENSHLHETCPPEVATLEQGSTAAILVKKFHAGFINSAFAFALAFASALPLAFVCYEFATNGERQKFDLNQVERNVNANGSADDMLSIIPVSTDPIKNAMVVLTALTSRGNGAMPSTSANNHLPRSLEQSNLYLAQQKNIGKDVGETTKSPRQVDV
ncbi:hypothetical protein NQ318_001125 [Aromia moschata]|uniref:Transmembrane protein n=1 Tax=Aromia moschata TaxID=1265417 RepID=A0AAV8ZH89_9CUCU|nr:hypothetical protein NQ318_001125 [Aromia moschata]